MDPEYVIASIHKHVQRRLIFSNYCLKRLSVVEMESIIIKPADTVQLEEIQNLLKNSGLPFEDINKHLKDFLCLMNNEEIIAVGGLEIYDDVALLRSLAVVEGKRNQGLGQLVYSALIEHAKSKNFKTIYLLTETAEKFFLKNGFTKVERNIIPDKIKNTHEYKVLCAESAIVLMKNI